MMGLELQFGVGIVQNVTCDMLIKRRKSIEKLGFDSVWVADQSCNCSRPTEPWFDGWTLLAAMATQTSNIRIVKMVTAIPWHNPAFLARKARTVDHLSNGRLTIGIGTGLPGDSGHKMTGIENWSAAKRAKRYAGTP